MTRAVAARDHATEIAKRCLAEADLHHDGSISFPVSSSLFFYFYSLCPLPIYIERTSPSAVSVHHSFSPALSLSSSSLFIHIRSLSFSFFNHSSHLSSLISSPLLSQEFRAWVASHRDSNLVQLLTADNSAVARAVSLEEARLLSGEWIRKTEHITNDFLIES